MYRDRTDAGEQLAKDLKAYAHMPNTVVWGLPRGGVPVARAVASRLDLPLDVFVVRKIGVPWHKEIAMGALSEGGFKLLNRDYIEDIGVTDEDLETSVKNETSELKRREYAYRKGRQRETAHDKIVLLVDDGLATGSTMKAALAAIRTEHPKKIVVAVPVSPPESAKEIESLADEFVCPNVTPYFWGVSGAYESFPQLTDEQVLGLLESRVATV